MPALLLALLAIAVVERPDLAAEFAAQGTPGTFVLFDVSAGRLTVVDAARAKRRYVPASTFKIANSLIALETGAVQDEREVRRTRGARLRVRPEHRHGLGRRHAEAHGHRPVTPRAAGPARYAVTP